MGGGGSNLNPGKKHILPGSPTGIYAQKTTSPN